MDKISIASHVPRQNEHSPRSHSLQRRVCFQLLPFSHYTLLFKLQGTVSPPSLCSVYVYARPLHLLLTLSHPQPRSNHPPSSSGSRNPLLLAHPQSQQSWQQTTAARRHSLPSSSPPPARTDRRPLLRSIVSVSSAGFPLDDSYTHTRFLPLSLLRPSLGERLSTPALVGLESELRSVCLVRWLA